MTDEQQQLWLDLKAHVCRALADPTTTDVSLRGVLLTLQRAGVEFPESEHAPPKRIRELMLVA